MTALRMFGYDGFTIELSDMHDSYRITIMSRDLVTRGHQCMMWIAKNGGNKDAPYTLYRCYKEGSRSFPKIFDLESDIDDSNVHRLKITGVDEI